MTKSDAQVMYETQVRDAVGYELFDWYVDDIRQAYDDDLSAEECIQMIDTSAERAWDRQQARNAADDGPRSVAERYAEAATEKRTLRIL